MRQGINSSQMGLKKEATCQKLVSLYDLSTKTVPDALSCGHTFIGKLPIHPSPHLPLDMPWRRTQYLDAVRK